MDNPEQYLLQVLRRTQSGLQDSLIPYHASVMQQLAAKLEQADVLKDEIRRLESVNGFTKAALSMQWILERVEQSGENFSPDQFDNDATTLSDKLFEAFLGEPFEAPSEGPVSTSPAESMGEPAPEAGREQQSEVAPLETAAPESTSESSPALQQPADTAEEPQILSSAEPIPQPVSETAPPAPVEDAPSLTDLLDQNLLLGFQRFTEIVSKLSEKTPAERKSVFAVLGMIARSSADVARSQGKKDVLDFFQSVLKFLSYVDSSGSSQDSRVSETMRDIGERLSKALSERTSGPALLQQINQLLQHPDSILKS